MHGLLGSGIRFGHCMALGILDVEVESGEVTNKTFWMMSSVSQAYRNEDIPKLQQKYLNSESLEFRLVLEKLWLKFRALILNSQYLSMPNQ